MRHVFVDESCQNAHRYMVLGALVMPGADVDRAEVLLEDLLQQRRHTPEMKWNKTSRARLGVYQDFVAFYFDRLVPRGAQFHALVVNCSELNHRAFNGGDPDLGFNKFLYQLLYHRVGKKFGHAEKLVVDLDARTCSRDVTELQTVLNSGVARYFGDRFRRPFSRVAHRCSKNSRLIQLADVLSGAVAWHRNQHDEQPDASAAKTSLANYIARRVEQRRLGTSSSPHESRLSVWNFQLR